MKNIKGTTFIRTAAYAPVSSSKDRKFSSISSSLLFNHKYSK